MSPAMLDLVKQAVARVDLDQLQRAAVIVACWLDGVKIPRRVDDEKIVDELSKALVALRFAKEGFVGEEPEERRQGGNP